MPIPDNITRDHVVSAIQRIDKEGVPPYKGIRKYAVRIQNRDYPVMLLISWANVIPNREELPSDPRVFQSQMAIRYLENLGFDIITFK